MAVGEVRQVGAEVRAVEELKANFASVVEERVGPNFNAYENARAFGPLRHHFKLRLKGREQEFICKHGKVASALSLRSVRPFLYLQLHLVL